MSKTGEILIIEDDSDDRAFFSNVLSDLSIRNAVVWFDNTDEAFQYLQTTKKSIFIILSEIHVPGRSGLEFKRQIDADPKLRKKSIPFIFYSTMARQSEVNQAYTQMTVQGFFKKGYDYDEAKNMFRVIFDYWTISKHPNTQ